MAEVMSVCSVDEIGLSPRKGRLCYQIFPDPSDFDCCCKLKDRLPSIVVEPSEEEVESGELRWPPEEFMVTEEQGQAFCPGTAGQGVCPGTAGQAVCSGTAGQGVCPGTAGQDERGTGTGPDAKTINEVTA